MNDIQIIPGITEKDLEVITKRIKELEKFAERVHVDIADGKFVGNTTSLGTSAINTMDTIAEIELHLMVENPKDFVPSEKGRVTKIISHVESRDFSREWLEELQSLEYEIGIAINPETEIQSLEPFLEYANSIQFMTIHPGFAGQKFLPEVLEKVKEFKKGYPSIPIEIDGGINPETAKLAVSAGATLLVSTSFLEECDDLKECIRELSNSK